MKGKGASGIDYGWKFNGRPVLLCEDQSLIADESAHQMEKALRQMSMEYYVLDRCMQCGICSSSCPCGMVPGGEPFSPRTFIQRARLGLLSLAEDELWECTHCGTCQTMCPYEIPFLDVMNSLRNLVVEGGVGHVPLSIRSALAPIALCGNPWKSDPLERTSWLESLDFPRSPAGEGEAICLFLGCLAGYEPRARKVAETAMELLARAQVPFEVMAAEEVCCGDTVRRVGDKGTFQRLMEKNRKNIRSKGYRTICTLSPHCQESLHTLYQWGEGREIRVVPFLKLMYEWVETGTLAFSGSPGGKVTFHDPCFFSKHLGMVNEPRRILEAIPGLELVEMEHCGRKSLCCGGGGGGIWRDVEKGRRLSELRLDEALKTGANTVVTSCPYCLGMLEDARRSDERYAELEIMDICELVWKGMHP